MSLYIKEVLIPEKVAEVVHRYSPIDTNLEELPEEAEDAAIFWINKSCQKFRERISLELALLTPTEEDEEDDLIVPDISSVEYLWDLSDGVALTSLMAFYCPEELSWRDICYANPMTMTDSIYNLQLIKLFCEEKLPCDVFFLTIEDFFDCNKLFRINVLAFVADLLYHFEIRPVDCVRPPTLHDIMSTEDEMYVGFNNGTSSALLRGARANAESSTTGHGFSAINHRVLNRSLASVTPVGHLAQVTTPASQACAQASARFGRRRSSITSNYGRVSLSGDGNYSTSGLGDITNPNAYATPPTSVNNSSSTLVRHSSSPVKGRRSSLDHSTRGEGEEDLSRYFSILEVVDHEPGRASPGTNNSPEQLHSSQSLHDVSLSPRNSTIFNSVFQEVRSSTSVLTPNVTASSSSFYSHNSQQQQPQQQHPQHQHQQLQQQQFIPQQQTPQPQQQPSQQSQQFNHSPFVIEKSLSSSRNHNSSNSQLNLSAESRGMAPRNSNLSNSQLSSNHESSRNLSSQFNEHKASLSSLHHNSSSSGIVAHSTPLKYDLNDSEITHSNSNATFNNSNVINATTTTTSNTNTTPTTNNNNSHQSEKSMSPRPSTPGVGFFIGTDGTVNNSTTELATTSTSELSMAKKKELIVQKSLKRKAEQEAKRLKMQEDAARKREEEYRKNEESERKKEEERIRKQKILEEYKLKKQAEEEKKRGDTVDWARSNGSSSTLGYNGNHGPNNKHATVVLNRQRGRQNSHHASNETVNSNSNTKTRPKSLHVSNALMEEFLSLDQRPSKTPAGTSTSGLSSSPPTYNTPLSRNDSFNPLQSSTNLSTGSSRPRSALSTSSKILSSTSTSHLSSIMPSMPTLYQRNRGPPSDGASDVGSNFSEYTGPKLYVKPSQKSNKGIILNAINVVLAGTVNADTKKKVIEVRLWFSILGIVFDSPTHLFISHLHSKVKVFFSYVTIANLYCFHSIYRKLTKVLLSTF